MKYEVEVISEEILPAIRSIMAKELHEQYGYKQKEIAKRLEITQPAVSQYINQNRAKEKVINKISDDPQTYIIIDDAIQKAAENKDYRNELQQIIQNIRDKGLLKEEFQETEKLLI